MFPSRSSLPWIVRLSAPRRLGIVLVIAMATFFALEPWVSTHSRLLICWNAGALTYLGLAWTTVARADATMTRVRAQAHDQSGYVIFLLVVTAASASLVAIGFLVGNFRNLSFWPRAGHLTLTISALLLSWLLIQTLFAFHYARWFYSRERESKTHRGGLNFPGDKEPDYLDFAYFAFVVGMTSQTSDVCVMTRHMRRLTLIHSVLAFIFNIAILAMSINIISSVI
jgi:uncharacterized membrane protein